MFVCVVQVRATSTPTDDVDPELARYLNRPYWENKHQTEDDSSPSAPANLTSPMMQSITKQVSTITLRFVSKFLLL